MSAARSAASTRSAGRGGTASAAPRDFRALSGSGIHGEHSCGRIARAQVPRRPRSCARTLAALGLGLTLVFLPPYGRVSADRFTAGKEISWETIRRDTAAFFSYLVFGGYDENRDGRIESEETLLAGAFRCAVLGGILAGAACGLLGAFITLRRMALFGDMLGHAVLPGIVAGFIVAGRKSTPELLGGALLAGLLAAAFTRAVRAHPRIKEDAALGIALSLFYALGMWLLAWVQKAPRLSAEATGLNHYLFGNASVVDTTDLAFLGPAALAVLLAVTVFYKELVVSTFDPLFAGAIGVRAPLVANGLLFLLTAVVVVSLKIMGIVLVAALLAIPAATAHLLTRSMRAYLALSAGLGAAAGFGGNFLSHILPVGTGPAIICFAFAGLLAAFLFAPRQGLLARALRERSVRRRTERENILASCYRVLEREPALGNAIPIGRLAAERGEPPAVTRRLARRLRAAGWGTVRDGVLELTAEGLRRAREVVRRHRLWELFLSREASLPADHVHPGAEELEHYLGEEAVRELERLLEHPTVDPHGREIPQAEGATKARRGGS